jgi:NAD(P)-dependent dehydrogenase (short-subunit alcohol dehydrogenase family)
VLISGASRGLGLEIARRFAAEGAQLALLAREEDKLAAAANELKRGGIEVYTVPCDVRDAEQARRAVEAVERRFHRIDVLINNAGVIQVGPVEQMGKEDYADAMAIHFWAPLHLVYEVVPVMKRQGAGRIVNITSISAYTASINRGDYCMVKAGLAMMTKLFADRLAPDSINVYEIRPGVIATDMTGGVKEKYDKLIIHDERGITPIRRWGKPEDIGRAVRAIAEDRFPFSTGTVFDVDGGFHLHRL